MVHSSTNRVLEQLVFVLSLSGIEFVRATSANGSFFRFDVMKEGP
jgi:hypothetical protein